MVPVNLARLERVCTWYYSCSSIMADQGQRLVCRSDWRIASDPELSPHLPPSEEELEPLYRRDKLSVFRCYVHRC